MISKFKISLVAVAALLGLAPLPASAALQRITQPNPKDAMAVQIFRLHNGLTVFLSENHETPRFSAQIAVRAGSKHDPAETTGLAHYLEHMLFKGSSSLGTLDFAKEKVHLDKITELYEQHFRETDPTKRQAIYAEINRENQSAAQYEIPNELDKVYNAMGEVGLNAHTWNEETVYEVNLPSNHLAQWAAVESDRFQNPVFRLFQSELEIVYEEKNRSLDAKERIIQEAVDRSLFKVHPYGQQTTLGEVEHLKNPSLKNVYAFYEKHYVPGNMAISISGDINVTNTIQLIDREFSKWQAKPVPAGPAWTERPLQGTERVTVKYKGEEFVLVAYRVAGRNDSDADALRFVDMILDNATAGLINLNLNQNQKVREAGSFPELQNDAGAQYLWGIPKAGQTLKEVEDLLVQQIELIKKGEFEDWILPAILTDFKKHRKTEFESNDSRVGLLSTAFIAYQDWDHVVTELDRMARLTKADVVRVANKYFGGGYVAGYRIDEQQSVPKIDKPRIDTINIDATRQSPYAKQILAMPVKPIEPVWLKAEQDYRKIDLEDGIKLYHVKNPLNDLFVLGITVEIGSRHDNRLGLAAELLDKSGTRRFNSENLKKEWYKLGTDLSVSVGENETRITLSGLDENFPAAWSLLMELLTDPVVDAPTLEDLKAIIQAEREDSKKDFRTLAQAVREFNRYGTNSSFLRALPPEKLAALKTDELQALIKSLVSYRRSMDYTGTMPLERVTEILKRRPALAAPTKATPPYRFFTAAAPARDRIQIFDKQLAQSQVFIEFADGTFDEANAPVVNLFNDYFSGGMSSVVFQELREARALAYDAWGLYSTGTRKGEQNLLIGVIGCQTDKTPEALTAFLDLFDRLPASPERFAEARESVQTRYRTGKLEFRQIATTVRAWEKLEVAIDPRPARFARLQALRLEDVMRFAETHSKGRPRLISIVGDRSKFDLAEAAKKSDIVPVSLKEIFAY